MIHEVYTESYREKLTRLKNKRIAYVKQKEHFSMKLLLFTKSNYISIIKKRLLIFSLNLLLRAGDPIFMAACPRGVNPINGWADCFP